VNAASPWAGTIASMMTAWYCLALSVVEIAGESLA
jgi:hypothetical protein